MAKSTELTVQETRELLLNPAYQAQKTFELQQRLAQMYVTSTIVPATYRGNIGNCVIAIDMAQRMMANPLMVMQNLYIVNGNPAWSAKFLISCINMCGRFTPLRYQFTGKRGTKQYGCRAYAYEKSDTQHKEPLCSVWITMDMAEKEGWTKKAGSKWLTIPDQMLIYRAAAFWSRAYAPEISMGFLTKEEAEEVPYEEVYDTPIVETTNSVIPEPPITDEPVGVETPTEPATETVEHEKVQPEQPEPQAVDNPADAIESAMQKQSTRRTNYRAPQAADEPQQPESVNTETGEINFDA